MDFTFALPVFLVTLREGVEAALVIGIVLACLSKANASSLNRFVYIGVTLGITVSIALGLCLVISLQSLGLSDWNYAPVVEQAVKGGVALVAIALLSWMLVWMTQQAKTLKHEVIQSVEASLNGGHGWGIFTLIFVAVLREGVETVLFVGSQMQQGWSPVLGAVAGLTGASMIGILIFQGGIKINLKVFFQFMGFVLLLIISGLVITALRKFESSIFLMGQMNLGPLNWCQQPVNSCILGRQVWDLSAVLPDRQFPGLVLKALFGYTQQLYLVQAIGYLVIFLGVGSIYWYSLRQSDPARP